MKMGNDHAEYCHEASSTPKLSFYTFPIKKTEPPGMVTPPPGTLASIPFKWEEAPGKPRAATDDGRNSPLVKSKTVRCLVPPPGGAKVTNTSSPTTVLEGPYVGRSLSLSQTSKSFSLNISKLGKSSFRSRDEERVVSRSYRMRDSKDKFNFSSWRWGSLKEGSMDFSSGVERSTDTEAKKMTRVRMRSSSSFLSLSSTSSNILSNIYESFKQAVVPWRRRPEKMRKT